MSAPRPVMTLETPGCSRRPARVWLGHVPIDALAHQEAVAFIDSCLDSPLPRHVVTCNLDYLRLACHDDVILESIRKAHLVTPDGMPVVWLGRLAGSSVPERVTGIALTPEIVRLAAEKDLSVFFLGGPRGVAASAARAAQEMFPGLQVAGCDDRWIDTDDDRMWLELVERIQHAGADVLLCALGYEKTARLFREHASRLICRLVIEVGQTIAIMAGVVRRAPRLMRRTGLEWLFRLISEPRRLWRRYALCLVYLPYLVILTIVSRLNHSSRFCDSGGSDNGMVTPATERLYSTDDVSRVESPS